MLKFKCPKCGFNRMEEVMTGVTVSTIINDLGIEDEFIDCNYGNASNDGGEVDRYQCVSCGHVVATNEEDLIEFLTKNKMV